MLSHVFAAGAYFVYLPQCWVILRKKLREGLSMWMPIVCALMAVIVATVSVYYTPPQAKINADLRSACR